MTDRELLGESTFREFAANQTRRSCTSPSLLSAPSHSPSLPVVRNAGPRFPPGAGLQIPSTTLVPVEEHGVAGARRTWLRHGRPPHAGRRAR